MAGTDSKDAHRGACWICGTWEGGCGDEVQAHRASRVWGPRGWVCALPNALGTRVSSEPQNSLKRLSEKPDGNVNIFKHHSWGASQCVL